VLNRTVRLGQDHAGAFAVFGAGRVELLERLEAGDDAGELVLAGAHVRPSVSRLPRATDSSESRAARSTCSGPWRRATGEALFRGGALLGRALRFDRQVVPLDVELGRAARRSGRGPRRRAPWRGGARSRR
jgi:hypothetical protein